jgi:hypothetical protein
MQVAAQSPFGYVSACGRPSQTCDRDRKFSLAEFGAFGSMFSRPFSHLAVAENPRKRETGPTCFATCENFRVISSSVPLLYIHLLQHIYPVSPMHSEASKPEVVQKKRKDKKGETKWTSTGEAELVSAFEEARKEGLQADSGWKPTAWQRVVHALAGSEKISGGAVKEVDACMRRDDSHDDARVKFIENLFYCYTTEICVRCKSRGNFTQESYRNLHLRESR